MTNELQAVWARNTLAPCASLAAPDWVIPEVYLSSVYRRAIA